MPWKCPACSTPIHQQLTVAGHAMPHRGVIYRCAVCRLELIIEDDHMVVAPMPAETNEDGQPLERG